MHGHAHVIMHQSTLKQRRTRRRTAYLKLSSDWSPGCFVLFRLAVSRFPTVCSDHAVCKVWTPTRRYSEPHAGFSWRFQLLQSAKGMGSQPPVQDKLALAGLLTKLLSHRTCPSTTNGRANDSTRMCTLQCTGKREPLIEICHLTTWST